MSIHDHLRLILTEEIENLGWSKALELAKVARSDDSLANLVTLCAYCELLMFEFSSAGCASR
jgi:hypothetical protein